VTTKADGPACGKLLDQLQYAAGFGIAFSLLGLFITIILSRS
jgi:hypothetical protein